MSISYYLPFFSLCLSLLHACDARHLDTTDDKKLEKIFHIPNIKNGEKGIDQAPILPETNNKSTLSNELGATRGDSTKETSLVDKAQKLKDKKANHQKVSSNNDETETISGNAVKNESLVSVSWRLPRNKGSEKHPGFNSDYSPPKTHPPSHN